MSDLNEAFEWLRPEVGDLLDAGDLVVGVGRIYYRGKGSGVERDPGYALEAVGLGN